MTKTMDWPASVPDRTKLVRYYIMEEGWSYGQLAEAFGVSRSAIAGVCYRAGIRKLKAATKKAVVGPDMPTALEAIAAVIREKRGDTP
jgi:hypothetical protein